jgi:hypothetical protein
MEDLKLNFSKDFRLATVIGGVAFALNAIRSAYDHPDPVSI